MGGAYLVVGMIGGITAAMLVTGFMLAVFQAEKFPWAAYLQSATIAIMALTRLGSTAAGSGFTWASKLLQQPGRLIMVTFCLLYWVMTLAEGTAPVMEVLDVLNSNVGTSMSLMLETLLWVLRIVFESVVPAFNALFLVTSDTLSHLVQSILDCDAVDGRNIVMTLVVAPVRGLGALVGA